MGAAQKEGYVLPQPFYTPLCNVHLMAICEICDSEVEEIFDCVNCGIQFCSSCGDAENSICNLCKEQDKDAAEEEEESDDVETEDDEEEETGEEE
jgi:hypothetical protein